eukprot:scaffold1999_cov119-Isochrysis_galbana.AAC.5
MHAANTHRNSTWPAWRCAVTIRAAPGSNGLCSTPTNKPTNGTARATRASQSAMAWRFDPEELAGLVGDRGTTEPPARRRRIG